MMVHLRLGEAGVVQATPPLTLNLLTLQTETQAQKALHAQRRSMAGEAGVIAGLPLRLLLVA